MNIQTQYNQVARSLTFSKQVTQRKLNRLKKELTRLNALEKQLKAIKK